MFLTGHHNEIFVHIPYAERNMYKKYMQENIMRNKIFFSLNKKFYKFNNSNTGENILFCLYSCLSTCKYTFNYLYIFLRNVSASVKLTLLKKKEKNEKKKNSFIFSKRKKN